METPARRRPRNGHEERQSKQVTTKYFMPCLREESVINVPVCKTLFSNTLGVKDGRLKKLCRDFFKTDDEPKETRGRDTKSGIYLTRKQSVKAFLEKVPILDSHYCRGKNIHRQYLSSELSFHKLWEKYESQCEDNLHVKYDYFRTVCITDYNIGFGAPATDCCSTCLSLKSEIKHARDLGKSKTLKLSWMFITKSSSIL